VVLGGGLLVCRLGRAPDSEHAWEASFTFTVSLNRGRLATPAQHRARDRELGDMERHRRRWPGLAVRVGNVNLRTGHHQAHLAIVVLGDRIAERDLHGGPDLCDRRDNRQAGRPGHHRERRLTTLPATSCARSPSPTPDLGRGCRRSGACACLRNEDGVLADIATRRQVPCAANVPRPRRPGLAEPEIQRLLRRRRGAGRGIIAAAGRDRSRRTVTAHVTSTQHRTARRGFGR
jgi:hypothetical protein